MQDARARYRKEATELLLLLLSYWPAYLTGLRHIYGCFIKASVCMYELIFGRENNIVVL